MHSDPTIDEVFKDFHPNGTLTDEQCKWLCKRYTFHFTNAQTLAGHEKYGTAPSRNRNTVIEGPMCWHCTPDPSSHPRLVHLPPLAGLPATWTGKLHLMIRKYIFLEI